MRKYGGVVDFTSQSQAYESLMTYSYTDSTWKDLLTSYDGHSITYDDLGNPLSYYNGQDYTFTWQQGRQLKSAVVGGKTVSFEYNANGIRTKKWLPGKMMYITVLTATA